ncbi:DNRLRE domain-containing protein [Paenibacillus sp. MMS18-CY102]|uniref:DNRLRE domain-containing protein n=1 Tax=Paenibacillus sp. MMS18-CY102 TaxID=2682849 RepID=UPI001365CA29|nr:DNRLRE domain-containing protein [Paenibacillus sp. MMS18-CY102]MWC29647.1 DNRLRE domain-containing protein [Paenibacillus sp. MMS18-CY102]
MKALPAVVAKKGLFLMLAAVLLISLVGMYIRTEQPASAATTSFRFVVLGDSRGSTDGINETTMRSLLSQIKALPVQPSFVVFTGDQVQGGSDVETELTDWKNIVDDYYPTNQVYPALGNHEHDETVFSNVFNYLPSNQLAGYQRSAYYYDYGNARFFVLNSDRTDANGKYVINSAQRTWLQSNLQNNGKTHNFITFHVPAYPIGAHYGSSLDANPAERDAFWSVVDSNNVTAVLVGHEHNYNRRKIDSSFNANGYSFTHNIQQVTLGGAGAPLSSTKTDAKGVQVGPVTSYHYMVVDVADETATFTVYDINGNVIDSFSETRGGGGTMPPVTTAVSFQDGVAPSASYAGTTDTHIMQNAATVNYGTATALMVDGDEPSGSTSDVSALLKWDVSSIPSGSTVTDAKITINVTDKSSSTYSFYEMKRSWVELQANWNQYAAGSSWQTAGAKGTLDLGSTSLGAITATATGSYTVTLNAAGIGIVQGWIANSANNKGVIISNSSNTDGLDFSSSEAPTASQRPKLTITYQ